MTGRRLLLVEDDPNLGTLLDESLRRQGYSVRLEKDGLRGRGAVTEEFFDLCLIDVMLPVMDGFTLAAEIRRSGISTP